MGKSISRLEPGLARGPLPTAAPPPSADEVIEEYLEHLTAPLVGLVPYRERAALRDEAAHHLDRLVAGYLVEGIAPAQAARLAVERYGPSHVVVEQALERWHRRTARGPLARRLGPGTLYALGYFGLATLAATLLLQVRLYQTDYDPLTFGLSPAEMREIIPAPLPLPDARPATLALAAFALVAPVAAGALTGWASPVRPARAVYQAVTVLTLYSFVAGMQMLPVRDGLLFALWQLFYWLPAGCLAAHCAAALAWRRRCSRYLPAPPAGAGGRDDGKDPSDVRFA